ncbi:MAG: response regulator [Candidatus Omnitrophica bacterium]|nr:response regulator [Candidatus Omnitrophota bacterium]
MDNASKKILVVDDDEEILVHLSQILRRARYEVITTTTGTGALQLAREYKPQLLLLDIMLPDMDGGEVAAHLLEDAQTEKIPILFLSGVVIKKEENYDGAKVGEHYMIAKPIKAEDLLKTIHQIIGSPA